MSISLVSAAAVAGGAALGALLRWLLTLALATTSPSLPLGTLLANLIGGLLIGITIGMLDQFDGLPVAWRLAVTTGFLGGLTTYSSFNYESSALALGDAPSRSLVNVGVTLVGCAIAGLLGLGLARLVIRQ